jgi:hypothetical protein
LDYPYKINPRHDAWGFLLPTLIYADLYWESYAMKQSLPLIVMILVMSLLPGCGGDREHPPASTDADRVMESYLANVEKIGKLLADVQSEAEAKAVAPEVLLIVQDMRDLIPKMKAITDKQQAETISKYRVKTKKINEQFAKDITHFVEIPGASEDLIKQLKSLPPVFGLGDDKL